MIYNILFFVAVIAILCYIASFVKSNQKEIDEINHQLGIQKTMLLDNFSELRTHIQILKRLVNDVSVHCIDIKVELEKIAKNAEINYNDLLDYLKSFDEPIKNMKGYFDARIYEFDLQKKMSNERMNMAKKKYFQVIKLRHEGMDISKIAKEMTEAWGFKVTSNDINELIKNIGEYIDVERNIEETNGILESNDIVESNLRNDYPECNECDGNDNEFCSCGNEEVIGLAKELFGRENNEFVKGDMFLYDNTNYRVVVPDENGEAPYCSQCKMDKRLCNRIACCAGERSDNQNIVFEEIVLTPEVETE